MLNIKFFILIPVSLLLSVILNHCFRKLSTKFNLIAYSGEHRQHATPTPLTGGISMFLAVLMAMLIGLVILDFSLTAWAEIGHYLFAIMLLVIIGWIDDRYNISFLWRFLAQIAAVFIMVQQGNALLDLGELFSRHTLYLGSYSTFMTIFATVGVINALNMSDGIDGLAGGYFLIALAVLAFFSFNTVHELIIIVWIGAILGFLVLNFPWRGDAKVFMGDAGSMVLGFTLAWLLINGSQDVHANQRSLFHPIFAVWLLALPLYDTVSVMLIRLLKGKSPFHADRMHMHHHVLHWLNSTKMSVLFMLSWFLVYVLIGVYSHLNDVEQYQQTILFSIVFVLHFLLQFKLSNQKKT